MSRVQLSANQKNGFYFSQSFSFGYFCYGHLNDSYGSLP